MATIMAIRCRFYDDGGNPIGEGCSMKGKQCTFVHPGDSAWKAAMPYEHAPSSSQSRSRYSGSVPTALRALRLSSQKSRGRGSFSQKTNTRAARLEGKSSSNVVSGSTGGWSSSARVEARGASTNQRSILSTEVTSGWSNTTIDQIASAWGESTVARASDATPAGGNQGANTNTVAHKNTSGSTAVKSKGDTLLDWSSVGGWDLLSGNNREISGESSTAAGWGSSSISLGGWGSVNTKLNTESNFLGGWETGTDNIAWGADSTDKNLVTRFSALVVPIKEVEMKAISENDTRCSDAVLEETLVATTVAMTEATTEIESGSHQSLQQLSWDSNWAREEIYEGEDGTKPSKIKDTDRHDSPDPLIPTEFIIDVEHILSELSEKYGIGPSIKQDILAICSIIKGTSDCYSGSLANAQYEIYKRMQLSSEYTAASGKSQELLDDGRKKRKKIISAFSRRVDKVVQESVKSAQTNLNTSHGSASDLPKPEPFLTDIVDFLQNVQRWSMDIKDLHMKIAVKNPQRKTELLEDGELLMKDVEDEDVEDEDEEREEEEGQIIKQPSRKKRRIDEYNIHKHMETVEKRIDEVKAAFKSRPPDLAVVVESRIVDICLHGANDYLQQKSSIDWRFDDKLKLYSFINEHQKSSHRRLANLANNILQVRDGVKELKEKIDEAEVQRRQHAESKEDFKKSLEILNSGCAKLRDELSSNQTSLKADQPPPPALPDLNSEVTKILNRSTDTIKEELFAEFRELEHALNLALNKRTEVVLKIIWPPLNHIMELITSFSQYLTTE